MSIECSFSEKTIHELDLLRKKSINLNPGFQRKSVWSLSDRKKLIQSILSNYPIPCIFLYRRQEKGNIIYDVIDGKQRLESIFYFLQDKYAVKFDFDNVGREKQYKWKDIKKQNKIFLSYKVQTVEVTGNLAEIIELFVRINSTGKPLTGAEKRNAKYYESLFLQEATKLSSKYQEYLLTQHILSSSQMGRMRDVELFSELLMSIHNGTVINKKAALDRALANDSIDKSLLQKHSSDFQDTIKHLKYLFPSLYETRFHQISDFYSLFMVIWEMRQNHFVICNQKSKELANYFLVKLSNGIDEHLNNIKKGKSTIKTKPLYADYYHTVQSDTDGAQNRLKRARILKGLLFSLFEIKDSKRFFSVEQRRLLWNSDIEPVCSKCKKSLTWNTFTIDHVLAHSKGGRTSLENADILCRSCNSKKGARKK